MYKGIYYRSDYRGNKGIKEETEEKKTIKETENKKTKKKILSCQI